MYSPGPELIITSLTCSVRHLHPRSYVLSSSYVSPRRGLNGLPVRILVVEYDDTVKAATWHICSQEDSHCAALSRMLEYSKSSVNR